MENHFYCSNVIIYSKEKGHTMYIFKKIFIDVNIKRCTLIICQGLVIFVNDKTSKEPILVGLIILTFHNSQS